MGIILVQNRLERMIVNGAANNRLVVYEVAVCQRVVVVVSVL